MAAKSEAAEAGVDAAKSGEATEGRDRLLFTERCTLHARGLVERIYDHVQWLCDGEEDLDIDPLVPDVEEYDSDSDHSFADYEDVSEEEWEGEEDEEYAGDEVTVPSSLRVAAPLGSLLAVVLSAGTFLEWVTAACDNRNRVFGCNDPAIVAVMDTLEMPALVALLPLVVLTVMVLVRSLQARRSPLLSHLRTLLQALLCCIYICGVGLLICGTSYYFAPTDGDTQLECEDDELIGQALEQSDFQGHGLIRTSHHSGTGNASHTCPWPDGNRTIKLTSPYTSGASPYLENSILDILHRGVCGNGGLFATKANDALQALGSAPTRDVREVAAAKAMRLLTWMLQLFLLLFVADKLEEHIEDAASGAELLQVWQEPAGVGVPWAFRERARG